MKKSIKENLTDEFLKQIEDNEDLFEELMAEFEADEDYLRDLAGKPEKKRSKKGNQKKPLNLAKEMQKELEELNGVKKK